MQTCNATALKNSNRVVRVESASPTRRRQQLQSVYGLTSDRVIARDQ
jgi:hypothetical protein